MLVPVVSLAFFAAVVFLLWTYLDEKLTTPPGKYPDFYYDLSNRSFIRLGTRVNRGLMGGCALFVALPLLLGLALYIWQMISPDPQNLWFGLAVALTLFAGAPFIVIFFEAGNMIEIEGTLNVAALLAAVGIAGLYLSFFAPRDAVPSFFINLRKPTVQYADMDVSLTLQPQSYTPGEQGVLTLRIHNTSRLPVSISLLTVSSTKEFRQGFIIDRPGLPSDTTVGERAVGFPGQRLEVDEALVREVPVVAHNTGDFSGDFDVTLKMSPESELKGKLETRHRIEAIILP